MNELSQAARKVQAALDSYGIELEVIEFSESTRTAVDAANTIGCTVGQIAKSLVFKTKNSGRPVLIIASGSNRVNEKTIRHVLGEKIIRPDAGFVREATGFSIGGVPPLGHAQEFETFIDEDLLQYDEIWAAAGTPRAVFRLAPLDLPRITGGTVIRIT